MEKTYTSVLKPALFMLMVIFRLSAGQSHNEKRPNYSPSQGGTNFARPNHGGNHGIHLTSCVRNCQCWAQSDSPMQPVFVNCTSANKDTVPQDAPPYVETLILNQNNIGSLSNSVLGHYERLEYLYIQENHISTISPQTFMALKRLKDLDLSLNRISQITRKTFAGLSVLQRLSLRENYIDKIHEKSFLMENNYGCCSLLRELDLSSNNLVTLSENALEGLYNLEILNLSGNRFREVPSTALKKLHQLGILDLSDNTEMQTISNSAFSENKGLKELKLRGCRIRSIGNSAFSTLGSLRTLDISGNHLENIPGNSMRQLIHLKTLHVGNNQIYEIKYNDLKSLENLNSFNMNGCYRDSSRNMRIYPDAFKENTKLREISITKCDGLSKIEENTFSFLTDLRILNLHGNGISSIEKDAIDFSTLEWFDLSGNEFKCTCDIVPWLSEIRKIKGKPISSEHGPIPSVHCAEPKSLSGYRLGELTSDDLNCDDDDGMSSLEIGLTVTGVIIACLLLLLLILYFCKRNLYGRNQGNVKSGINATNLPQPQQNIYCCFGESKPKSRKGRVKRPSGNKQQHILKKDITVETIPLRDKQLPQGWKDVEAPEEQMSDEGIYECMPDDLERPCGPPNANYPDVKLSIISTTL